MKQADVVIARDAGLDEAPAFDWQPLVDLTDQEQASILKETTEAANTMVGGYIASEGDAQRLISERTGFRFMDGVPTTWSGRWPRKRCARGVSRTARATTRMPTE